MRFLPLQKIPHLIEFYPIYHITVLNTNRNSGLYNYSWWRTVYPSLKDWSPNSSTESTVMGNLLWVICLVISTRPGKDKRCIVELLRSFILVQTLVKTNVSFINHHFSIYRNVKAWCIQASIHLHNGSLFFQRFHFGAHVMGLQWRRDFTQLSLKSSDFSS